LHDSTTKYFATCNKWLSKDEGDGQTSRDLILKKNKTEGRPSEKKK